ncbi:tail fiber assembly protein [Burkholderia contaminans]|uniref:tail fiber assembly protein n=1 Tax=Burkholderia contaminans TaxID=488447 RepID=UPI0014542017|nr:tail fiber assembly protein [Burkholderia contaminans]VWD62550.1 phage tail fiber assembly protein [Burkholderia contaminans]
MKIYNYHFQTGAFVSADEARPDPLNPDRWLRPAFSTETQPPKPGDREWPFWTDGVWQMKPDYRDVPLYRTTDGVPASIAVPGVVPSDVELTETRRPSALHVWRDDQWVEDAELVAQKARADAMAEFARRMEIARQANFGKADAYAAGLLSDVEVAIFNAWAAYQMALTRVVSAPDFPVAIIWPTEPDESAIAEEVADKARQREKDVEAIANKETAGTR